MTTGFTPPRSPLVRWSPSLAKLSALSVRQPWAWLIVSGFKDIENRSWRINGSRTLLIHAGLNHTDFNDEEAERIERRHGIRIPDEVPIGAIIGVVNVVDCAERHPSQCFEPGGFGWVLANARRLKPRPCKGAVGLFHPEFYNEESGLSGRARGSSGAGIPKLGKRREHGRNDGR